MTLNTSCLPGALTGYTFSRPSTSEEARMRLYYRKGTKATVHCVERHGDAVTDTAGKTSSVWLSVFVYAKFVNGPLKVYVPYAAAGYADTFHHVAACHGTS